MSIMHYNGGSVIAMAGKDCVAIASDLRLGNQALTVATNHDKIFALTDHCYVGLPGFATDTATVYNNLRYRTNIYNISEQRVMSPEAVARMVSSALYGKRFGPYFVEPILAGISKTPSGKARPFIASMDLIGCLSLAKDFACAGTASSKMMGMAESLWEPDLEPEDLFETISQAILNALDRDALSGSGVVVYVITLDKVIKRTLKARMD